MKHKSDGGRIWRFWKYVTLIRSLTLVLRFRMSPFRTNSSAGSALFLLPGSLSLKRACMWTWPWSNVDGLKGPEGLRYREVQGKTCGDTVADPVTYHWRERPQVSFSSRQTRVCHDRTRLLSRQKYACRDKIMFVATKYLSRQTRVCRNKTFLSRQNWYLWQLPPVIVTELCI